MSAGIGIATGFFTSAAAGILGALHVPPFQELRRFFFALNAGLAFAFLCLAAPFRPALLAPAAAAAWGGGRLASVAAALAVVLAGAYITALYLPGGRQARGILALATTAALIATAADGWEAGHGGAESWIFALDALAAAALLGTVIVAMLLGHWYLVRHRLPVGHLVRFALLLAGAIGIRAAIGLGGWIIVGARSPAGVGGYLADLAVRRGLFFWPRVFFGILGPAAFAYMTYETARIKSTQSATGILYIAVIFVLIGEFLARFLAVAGAGPM